MCARIVLVVSREDTYRTESRHVVDDPAGFYLLFSRRGRIPARRQAEGWRRAEAEMSDHRCDRGIRGYLGQQGARAGEPGTGDLRPVAQRNQLVDVT